MKTAPFVFPGQKHYYSGKVRDMYFLDSGHVVAVVSNRISAFDVVLPRPIPGKDQVLNEIATHFLNETRDIVPNWLISSPLSQVSIGHWCVPLKVEMVVRGHLAGSMWRSYAKGQREFWGVTLPDGMREWERLPEVMVTPTTKAEAGHDESITREEIIEQGLATEQEYDLMHDYTLALFAHGRKSAQERGLILVDTKYEFGTLNGEILLIDEVNTPDSSRYIYAEGFEDCVLNGTQPKQLSKEFVRQWLMENGFEGKEGQEVPEMTDEVIAGITERYLELGELILGRRIELKPLPEGKEEFAALMQEQVLPAIAEKV